MTRANKSSKSVAKAPCKGERDTKAKRCILVRYGYAGKAAQPFKLQKPIMNFMDSDTFFKIKDQL